MRCVAVMCALFASLPPASHRLWWTSVIGTTTWCPPWLRAWWSTRRPLAWTPSPTRTSSTSWTASTWAASPHACSWTSTVSIALGDWLWVNQHSCSHSKLMSLNWTQSADDAWERAFRGVSAEASRSMYFVFDLKIDNCTTSVDSELCVGAFVSHTRLSLCAL